MSLPTYSETQGLTPIDWNKELAAPPEIPSARHEKLCDAAISWVTCAVGSQCCIIPRGAGGAPEDDESAKFGARFYRCFLAGMWDVARETLAKIEVRSAVLIAEELAKREAV